MRRDREHTCVTKEKPRLCKVGLFGDEFHANRAITFLTQRMLYSISFVSCHSIHFLSFFFLIFNIRWSLLSFAPILSNSHARICVYSNFKFIQN